MSNLSIRDMKKAATRYETLKTKVASIKKKAEHVTEKFVRTVEVSGAAFAMGVANGRSNDPEGVNVAGVPVDLGAGISLQILGYLGAAGKHSDHLNNIGDGCLAHYAAVLGRGVGVTWKEKGTLGGGAQGALGARASGGLSPAELQAAAAMAAAAGVPR
jgi:hypothetical protein